MPLGPTDGFRPSACHKIILLACACILPTVAHEKLEGTEVLISDPSKHVYLLASRSPTAGLRQNNAFEAYTYTDLRLG